MESFFRGERFWEVKIHPPGFFAVECDVIRWTKTSLMNRKSCKRFRWQFQTIFYFLIFTPLMNSWFSPPPIHANVLGQITFLPQSSPIKRNVFHSALTHDPAPEHHDAPPWSHTFRTKTMRRTQEADELWLGLMADPRCTEHQRLERVIQTDIHVKEDVPSLSHSGACLPRKWQNNLAIYMYRCISIIEIMAPKKICIRHRCAYAIICMHACMQIVMLVALEIKSSTSMSAEEQTIPMRPRRNIYWTSFGSW